MSTRGGGLVARHLGANGKNALWLPLRMITRGGGGGGGYQPFVAEVFSQV